MQHDVPLHNGTSGCAPLRGVSPVQWAARLVLAVAFGLGAASKIVAPLSSVPAIESLSLPILSTRPVEVVAAIAGVEASLAMLLVVAGSRRVVLGVAGLVLVGFTLVLVALRRAPDAPGCGCLSLLSGPSDPQSQISAGLIRNTGLLLAVAWMMIQPRPLQRSIRSVVWLRRGAACAVRRGGSGFTVVELLVTIAIVAVVISLTLPSIQRTRAQGRASAALVLMRQAHASTMLYASDFQDALPYLAAPRRPWERLVVGGILLRNSTYFRQSELVFSVVFPHYAAARAPLEYTRPPVDYPPEIVHSRFDMTHTAFALAPYWRGAAPPDDLSLYVGLRVSDAAFPSSKGLLYDDEQSLQAELATRRGELGPWLVSRVDGGGLTIPFDPGYVQPFIRPYGAAPTPPMMMTVGGFEGRDF